jgi:hypothetical protein
VVLRKPLDLSTNNTHIAAASNDITPPALALSNKEKGVSPGKRIMSNIATNETIQIRQNSRIAIVMLRFNGGKFVNEDCDNFLRLLTPFKSPITSMSCDDKPV